MRLLGVVAALPAEARCLVGRRCAPRELIARDDTAVCVSAIGLERARAGAMRLLSAGARALLSWGAAGALEPSLKPGTLVVPSALAHTSIEVDGAWRQRLLDRLQGGFGVSAGQITQASGVLATPQQKAAVFRDTGAAAVDMESTAVGEAAAGAGVPFLIVRGIADPQGLRIPAAALAAGKAGLRRIVYTSSVATLGRQPDGSPADEDTPVGLGDMIGHYKRSKFLAEQEVRRFADSAGLPVVIVNPSTPIGPRDIKPTPTGRMIVDAARGRMPAYVDTGLNLVHVDDVAQGHVLAFERGQVGQRYILGGQNLTLREIFEAIASLTGRPGPRIRLPHAVVLPIAYLSEAWARLTKGGEPRATVDAVRMSKKPMFFSSEKAERDLGYRIRPVAEAFRDAVEWFGTNAYLA